MSDETKLHIDEDWKAQVDREKEQLRRQKEITPTDTAAINTAATNTAPVNATGNAPESSPTPPSPVRPARETAEHELPPASLIILISSLATQAMASMGQLPAEDGNPLPVDLQFARHFIDLIGVIEEKTRNNLTTEEASFLKNTLLHLRMLFVESSRR